MSAELSSVEAELAAIVNEGREPIDAREASRGSLQWLHAALGLDPNPPAEELSVSFGAEETVSLHFGPIVRSILSMASSVSLSYFLEMLVPFISLFFLGHMGNPVVLAGGAMGVMFVNVTGLAPGFGMASALDTLCSQAFGAGTPKLVGLHLQRAAAILGTLAVPVSLLWLNAERLMLALGQHHETSAVAGTVCRVMILGLPAIYSLEILKKFLYAQRVAVPQMAVMACGVPFHLVALVVMIRGLGMGFIAIPISICLTWSLMATALCVYVLRSGLLVPCWPGFSRAAFKGWGAYIALGAPGALMMLCEWASFELLTLVSGLLGPQAQAAQAVTMNIASILYMVPLGVAIATSALTGNMFGAGSRVGAQRTAVCAIGLVICTGSVLATFLALSRTLLPRVYTDDPAVVSQVATALTVVAAMHIFDSLQGAAQGVLRGAGRQLLGALCNFLGYVVLGVPLGSVLAIHARLGVAGLWLGMLVGVVCTGLTFLVVLRRQNWDKYIELAAQRALLEAVVSEHSDDERALELDFPADEFESGENGETGQMLAPLSSRP